MVDIGKSRNELIRANLVRMSEEIHPWERGHGERVMMYSLATAEQLNWSQEQMERLQVAAALHDVGKLMATDGPWREPNRPLLEGESELVRDHCEKGAQYLAGLGVDPSICEAVAKHHERLDGSGYPRQAESDEIPLMARIIGLAEYFDGLAFGPWSKKGAVEARKWVLAAWPGLWGEDVYQAFLVAETVIQPVIE